MGSMDEDRFATEGAEGTEPVDELEQGDGFEQGDDPAAPAPTRAPVEVRRNVALSAAVAGVAVLLAVAFAARAFTDGSALDWLSLAVLLVIVGVHASALIDARAPLLVADEHGVRLRTGARWRGVAWGEIDCLEHLPRGGLLRDGHLLVDGVDAQQLVVPLTLATRVVGTGTVSVGDALAELAAGRADVVEVVPDLEAAPSGSEPTAAPSSRVPYLSDLYDDEPRAAGRHASSDADLTPQVAQDAHAGDDSDTHGDDEGRDSDTIAAQVSAGLDSSSGSGAPRWADQPAADGGGFFDQDARDTGEIAALSDDEPEHPGHSEHSGHSERPEPPEPTREMRASARVEALAQGAPSAPTPSARPAVVLAAAAPTVGQAEETVVLADLAQPVADPVIGPELAAARARLRLTIDQLSERTRIRAHVIEAIEVDDFGPCGGDFYARGHLRTLARVLGIDAAPLVTAYDDRYAHEPVDPRRVFESELATGAGGTIRSTRGGRNWSVLIAFVMAGVLIWSVARLAMGGPTPTAEKPYVLNQSGGVTSTQPGAEPVLLRLTAAGGGATLVVRDGAGKVVFDGALAFGQTTRLRVAPPVRVQTSDGSVTYAFGKDEQVALGETGAEVSTTLVPR